jgi:hypothetical protein
MVAWKAKERELHEALTKIGEEKLIEVGAFSFS